MPEQQAPRALMPLKPVLQSRLKAKLSLVTRPCCSRLEAWRLSATNGCSMAPTHPPTHPMGLHDKAVLTRPSCAT